MALFHLVYFSDVLGVQTPVDVIIPEGKQGIGVDAAGEAELPKVLYLLHGTRTTRPSGSAAPAWSATPPAITWPSSCPA